MINNMDSDTYERALREHLASQGATNIRREGRSGWAYAMPPGEVADFGAARRAAVVAVEAKRGKA